MTAHELSIGCDMDAPLVGNHEPCGAVSFAVQIGFLLSPMIGHCRRICAWCLGCVWAWVSWHSHSDLKWQHVHTFCLH